MTYKILSCDGGGIRGLLSAMLIQDLDKRYNVVKKADGFAGTSTGGLIALALARGIDISEIVQVYSTQGSTIFTKNDEWLAQKEALENGSPLAGPGYLVCEYLSTGLQKVANELLGNGNMLSLRGFVAINSARLWSGNGNTGSWAPATFTNVQGDTYSQISLVDAALATSAAPSYFPPHEIGAFGYFADGGVFANNPSMVAIAESLGKGRAGSLANLRVLSIGTGISPEGIPPASVGNPLHWGVSSWLSPFPAWLDNVPQAALLGLTMDTTATLATQQAGQLLSNSYQRAYFVLSQPIPLDDWQNVALLTQLTNAYMQSSDWQAVRQWVEQNWN
jgi:patatin-like phospholipase/acyl hydrolase